MLKTVQHYTTKWSLDVSVQKTKNVVTEMVETSTVKRWFYSGENLVIMYQVVNKVYL